MKKAKKLLSLVLAICLIGTMFTFPVVANAETEVTRWKSSDYLNPDSPVTENNPWSVESQNNTEGVWAVVTGTTQSNTAQALFPKMADGVTPTTGYIVTGTDASGEWGQKGTDAAVNGKYMIAAGFDNNGTYAATPAKIAKVFTAPKTGKIRISADSVMYASTSESRIISTASFASWDDETARAKLYWEIHRADGTSIWKKDGNTLLTSSDISNNAYKYTTTEEQFIEVTAGEKIYFTFQPNKWMARANAACIWDPVVEYVNVVTDTDKFVSSKYLTVGTYYQNNPWSLESTNTGSKEYETFDSTNVVIDDKPLFPTMPDGNTPTTAYVRNGNANWGNQGFNMAVNGKYMIPACIWTGTTGDGVKTASGKMAKVFTAPKAGKIRISAGATKGFSTEGKVVAMTLSSTSGDATKQNWNIIKNGTTLATANGGSRVAAASYDTIEINDVVTEVVKGDKIYFEFTPAAWAIRANQACMWDPMVEYLNEVDDTTEFVSSKYLNPEVLYVNNPWSVESNNNWPNPTWMVVTNRTPHISTEPIFPPMPDGKAPETAYIATGDFNKGWGGNSVNAAVNGIYMIGGALWYNGSDANTSATAKIAKVFTAPKDGTITITAKATMGAGSENLIVPAKISNATHDDGLSWTLSKGNPTDGEILWTGTGNSRITGDDYDKILFNDMTMEVKAGDKLYFSINPSYGAGKGIPRSTQACLWDPAIKYITLNEVDDADSFKSSKYLTPEVRYADNPWSVEVVNNLEKTWATVTGTTPALTSPALSAYPTFPDGATPESGYFHSGKSWLVTDWNVDSYNAMVSGKYMVSPVTYESSAWKTPRDAKVAKVFTAPEDGMVKLTAAATIGEETEGLIVLNKVDDWNLDNAAWSVEKADGTVLWSKTGSGRIKNQNYDAAEFGKMYVEVKKGDKLYFSLNGRQYASRESHACLWDPVVTYVSRNIFGDATYANGTVTLDILKVDSSFDKNTKLIIGAFKSDETLLGSNVMLMSDVTSDGDITITGLNEKPDVIKIFVWNFGENGDELTPISSVIERIPVE